MRSMDTFEAEEHSVLPIGSVMIIYFPYWDMVSFTYFANIIKSQRGRGIFFLAGVVRVSLQHQEGQLCW